MLLYRVIVPYTATGTPMLLYNSHLIMRDNFVAILRRKSHNTKVNNQSGNDQESGCPREPRRRCRPSYRLKPRVNHTVIIAPWMNHKRLIACGLGSLTIRKRHKETMGFLRLAIAVLITALMAVTLPDAAIADSIRRTIGNYELTASYASEPLYLEESNAIVLEVHDIDTGQPVVGLERTMKIQLTIVVEQAARSFEVNLRAAKDRPGVYEGVFVPPVVGQYTFRVFGAIGETPIDEQFTAGQGGLGEVVVREGLDYSSPGALIALSILGLYLVGMAFLATRVWLRRHHQPAH